ncbi:hypothetical protein BDB00DRAFT_873065 [Zychaea mexicana]|uniref:uncharacterized protein n=1 Tax=Zychaea mexicana TaxID=64656 RepID=UPI0022FF384A|nr:uncharacterized protein BDB00DRAFT_873065 [Zychaea mexicana]KAI9492845.1 hypothetical protein BDB00DRAFT_873065 [Zychaea mexicana]
MSLEHYNLAEFDTFDLRAFLASHCSELTTLVLYQHDDLHHHYRDEQQRGKGSAVNSTPTTKLPGDHASNNGILLNAETILDVTNGQLVCCTFAISTGEHPILTNVELRQIDDLDDTVLTSSIASMHHLQELKNDDRSSGSSLRSLTLKDTTGKNHHLTRFVIMVDQLENLRELMLKVGLSAAEQFLAVGYNINPNKSCSEDLMALLITNAIHTYYEEGGLKSSSGKVDSGDSIIDFINTKAVL